MFGWVDCLGLIIRSEMVTSSFVSGSAQRRFAQFEPITHFLKAVDKASICVCCHAIVKLFQPYAPVPQL